MVLLEKPQRRTKSRGKKLPRPKPLLVTKLTIEQKTQEWNKPLDPVKQEDGALALDGDVTAQLHDPLVLVVAGVEEPGVDQ